MIKVSIVMPVFNAVKYIDKAIKSILNQTYNNFELIIIDDGATDGTGEKCRMYAEKYSNIIYEKQKNAGTCAARNKGIMLARGEYISFSDHDDEYYEDYLQCLVELADSKSLSMAKCSVLFEETYVNGKKIKRKEYFDNNVKSKNKLIEEYNSLPISFFGVWNTLYRTSLIRDNGVRFLEDIRHGQEDYMFNTELLPFIQNVGFTNKILYKHYRRVQQSTSAKFYEDRIDAMIIHFNKEVEVLRPLIKKSDWTIELPILYSRKITGIISYCLSTEENKSKQRCLNAIKKFNKEINYKTEILNYFLYMKIFKKSFKYGLIFFLACFNQYSIIIYLWNKKNNKNRGKRNA